MPDVLSSGELQELLDAVENLQRKEALLADKLRALAEQCKAQKWLIDGSAETLAAEICQTVSLQQRIRSSGFSLLDETLDLSQANACLTLEMQRLQTSFKEETIVQRFCALETSDDSLARLLPDRKAHLRALTEPGADETERRRWLDACGLLLDQLEMPDVARSRELLAVFQDTLGVEFFAGIFSTKLTLPTGWKSQEPQLPVVEPASGPETSSEPPAQQERDAAKSPSDIIIEGAKRDQEPSGKRLVELLRKLSFQDVLDDLERFIVVSEELESTGEGAGKQIASLVKDGYLTKVTLNEANPRVFCQASPRLCAGIKKQIVQAPLRKAGYQNLSLRALPEEWFNKLFLEQVYLTQQTLLLLQRDSRLSTWHFGESEIVCGENHYRMDITFQSEFDTSVSRCIISLEGVEDRESAWERLDTPHTAWVMVHSQKEIPHWIEKLKAWDLPAPEWTALDAPEDYFLADGTRRSFTQLFHSEPVPAAAEGNASPAAGTVQDRPPAKSAREEISAREEPLVPPEPEPPHVPVRRRPKSELFELDKPEINFQEQTAQWAAEGKFPLALCLIRSAASYNPELVSLQKQLAYALDDPMEDCEYLNDRLSDIYAVSEGPWGDREVFQALRASAYLRMAFSSAAVQQSYQIVGSLQSFSGEAATPSLSGAFHLLSHFMRTQRRGVDRQIIRQIRQQGDVSTQLEELAKKAAGTCTRRWNEIDHKMERIKLMFDYLFGSQSTMMRFLKAIAEQRKECREEVRAFCAENQLIDADGMTDRAGIGRFIDRTWQSMPAKRGKNSNVTGNARTQAMNRMASCVDICVQWLDLTEGSPLNNIDDVAEQCNRLAGYLSKARDELAAQAAAGTYVVAARAILSQTLTDLTDALQGKLRDREAYFADFLYTGFIELDGDFRPILERPEHIIPGCEPWNCLRRHNDAMIRSDGSWDVPVERILGRNEDQPDYRNFGSAQLIMRHCGKLGLPIPTRLIDARLEDDDRRTLPKVKEQEDRFRAELELAATYGQIEDNTHKERLVTAITKQKREHFDETRNWGSYFSIMRACLRAVRKHAEKQEPRYRYEFDELKQKMDDCPLFEDIERLLKQRMFSVAHDYIQLAVKEHITEAPQGNILQTSQEKDNLRLFLNEYNTLQHRSAEKKDKETLYDLARFFNHNKVGEDTEKLLKAWPQNGQSDVNQMKTLFQALSFPVSRVEARKGGLFRVEMNTSAANMLRFPHPISAFGTELFPTSERGRDSGLDVYILNGKKTTDELVQKINGLRLDSRPTIFLLNWSIPLAERRELARKLKQDSTHPFTAIIVDRVLMLFLARYSQAERAQVLLQCALPFHSYNPYTEGNVSPEMFMGRDEQLKAILRNGQANIIYGGRQLGKTALLRRAASLVDNRKDGHWAIYTDKICRQNYKAALVEVYKCLCQNEFLEKTETPEDWAELCDRIQARMDRPGNQVKRFLLLLDEADQFLESCSPLTYRPVECLYQLELSTGNRFKFVLAGLHNVMRFSREGSKGNSVLGKLDSLTIKPLTFQEASQLLELPLYYLGFRMKPEQDVLLSQILLSANYYPGLIQFYCRQLVDSLKARRAPNDSAPPYPLDEGTIRNLLQKEDFVKQIREKFFITLDVEEDKLYYRALAYTLAYCYYDCSEDSVEGYTFEQLRDVYEGFEIRGLCQLESENVKTLLSEMEELNVLVQMDGHYTFNGANFRHMMGDEETVMNELDRLGGEGS